MLNRIRKTQQVILCCEKPLSYTELIVHIKLDPTRTQPQEKKRGGRVGEECCKYSLFRAKFLNPSLGLIGLNVQRSLNHNITLIWIKVLRTSPCLFNFKWLWDIQRLALFPSKCYHILFSGETYMFFCTF